MAAPTLRRAVPTLFAAWLATLYLVTTPPFGTLWPDPQDLVGYALMALLVLPRARAVLMRPAPFVLLLLALWLCIQTPDVLHNSQMGHVLLGAAAMLTGLASSPALQRRFHAALLAGGAFAMALTFGAWTLGKGLLLSSFWNEGDFFPYGTWYRWAGPTAHPNLFAYLATVTLWAGLSWHWRGRRWEAIAMGALGTLMGFGLFATLSRTGWILFWATALAGCTWLWRQARRGGMAWPRVLPALLLVATAAVCFAGAIAARPDLVAVRIDSVHRQLSPTPEKFHGSDEYDIVSRGNVYPDAWNLIREAPWTGHGLAAYLRLGRYNTIHSHQLELELLLCGGIPALVIVLGGLCWALVRGRDPFLRGMLCIALVGGLSDCVLFFKWPLIWLAFSAGAALRHVPATDRQGLFHRLRSLLRPHAAVIIFFALLALVYQVREEFSIDFHAYYGAMRWSAETGKPPYQAWNGGVFDMGNDELSRYLREHQTESLKAALRFLYPPSAFAQLRAFTWIEDPAYAARVWRMFNLAVLAATVALASQWLPRASRGRHTLMLALLIAASSPVRDTLWLGQVSIWVSFLMLVYLRALECRRPVIAGAALAIAAALKIYPGFWLVMLLLYPGRRVRPGAAFACTLGALVALSVAVDGIDIWRAYWENVASKIGDAPPPGGVTLFPFVDNLWVNRALLAGLFGACAGYAWRLRRATLERKRMAFLAMSAALFLGLPLVWAHYLVLVEVPLAAWCVTVFTRRRPPGYAGHAALAAYVLSAHAWPFIKLLGPYLAWPMRVGLLLAASLPAADAADPERRCIPPTAPI